MKMAQKLENVQLPVTSPHMAIVGNLCDFYTLNSQNGA